MQIKQLQLMLRECLPTKGFSLIEIVLVSALFVLLFSVLVGNLIYGQESTMLAGNRSRAVFLAEEGLEATRNIRDDDFANLVDGTYGLYNVGGEWSLVGSFDINDIYTRQVTVSSIDANTKQIVSQIDWQQTPQRTGTVSFTSYLTNWAGSAASPPPVTTCTDYCNSIGKTLGTCRQNKKQCSKNSETHESGGDIYCVAEPANDTCCCSLF